MVGRYINKRYKLATRGSRRMLLIGSVLLQKGRRVTPYLDPRKPLHLLVAAAILLSIATPIINVVLTNARYNLTPKVQALVGTANGNLASKLVYDAKAKAYSFNADAVQSQSDPNVNPLDLLKSKVGGAGKKSDQLYGVTLPQDMAKGVTFSDVNTKLSFQLIPQFKTMSGQEHSNHLIYPVSGHNLQAIYSLKNNGIKEDLVLPAPQGNSLSFSYKLQLPDTLVAKQLPDGSIGIYSGDPVLFNVQANSTEDQQKVMLAQKNSEKNYLVFGIPAPVIRQSGTTSPGSQAKFILDGTTLTVTATNLARLSYPISIDPSVVVTSTSDFATGNNEDGNIDFPANQINRGGLSGATVGNWGLTTLFNNPRYGHTSVAYNGYLYVLGGNGSAILNDVQYAPINANGTIGTWTATTSFTTVRWYHTSVAYNGYLYVLGGTNNTVSTYYNDVQYAPINANGTVGTWNTTTVFNTGRYEHTSVAYNGYLYVLGGTGSVSLNDVQYAPINANGTVGTWATTTAFTTARYGHTTVAYNGYLYVLGGTNGTVQNDVQNAPINANGTIGVWATTTAFTTARYNYTSVTYNGYIYIIGGNSGSSNLSDVQYAPINADGTVGAWVTAFGFATGRYGHTSVAYNGYIYILSGFGGGTLTDLQYAKLNSAGAIGSNWSSANALPANLSAATSIAYNGYIYEIGGTTGTGASSSVYYAPLNANGTLGGWLATSSLINTTRESSSVAYNGYVYEIGGWGGVSGLPLADVEYARICTANISGGGCTGTAGPLGTWTATSNLPAAAYQLTSVTYNGYIYKMGGRLASGQSASTVYYALVCTGNNSGVGGCTATAGTVGTWNATTSMPSTIHYASSIVNGGYIYEIGGYSTTSASLLATVYYALICTTTNSGSGGCTGTPGTVGTWNTTTSLPVTTEVATAVVSNGDVYLLGGYNGTAFVATVYYAPLNTNGTVGTWNTTTSLPAVNETPSSALYNGFIYVLGGDNGGATTYNTVSYDQINNGGPGTTSTGTFSTSFSTARYLHTSVAYNGYLYVIGGYSGTVFLNDVQYALICTGATRNQAGCGSTPGGVGTWFSTNSFTTARYLHTSVAYNGYLYVIGGQANSTYFNDVQYALICTATNSGSGGCTGTPGTVGTWGTTTSINTARIGHTSVVYNGYLYVIGGVHQTSDTLCNSVATTYCSDVQYAPINANGTIGTWTATTSLNTARTYHTSVVYNGYLYVIGGTASSGILLNDVQYALICTATNNGSGGCTGTPGTVGAWNSTTNFNDARSYHKSVVYNGYLYILGGQDQSSDLNDVQYAPINANGTIGTWIATANFLTVRAGHTAIVSNGSLYVLGGSYQTGSYLNDSQYATLNVIPRVASYSKLLDLGSTQTVCSINYNGTLSNGGVASVAYQTSTGTTFSAESTLSNLAPGNATSTGNISATSARYVWFDFNINDSLGAVFPDSGNNSQITDITVSTQAVHPQPNLRMRSGKWFNNQVLQPYDTVPAAGGGSCG